jgi:hypothetical protein
MYDVEGRKNRYNGIGVARVVAVRDYLAKYGISVSKGKINTVITKESVVDIR